LSLTQEISCPLTDAMTNAVVLDLVEKAPVWNFIEGLREVQEYWVCLVPVVNIRCKVLNYMYELALRLRIP
jgi:hypothetical protein